MMIPAPPDWQQRILGKLPHELTAEDKRRLLQRILARLADIELARVCAEHEQR